MRQKHYFYVVLDLLGLAILLGCSRAVKPTQLSRGEPGVSKSVSKDRKTGTSEAPAAPEENSPGDIPDNQAFVVHKSTEGNFQVKVPEGWAQKRSQSEVSFTDKLNTIAIKWTPSSEAPRRRNGLSQ